MNADKIVIGLAGMPGSGKSLAVETAKQVGYVIVTMGDVIRQETLKRGLELTPQNVGKVMLELRQEGGNTVIAEKCVPKIEEQTAIAEILSDMDAEIEQLEQKLAKYRMIKQGMMQELLTGKTRLI